MPQNREHNLIDRVNSKYSTTNKWKTGKYKKRKQDEVEG